MKRDLSAMVVSWDLVFVQFCLTNGANIKSYGKRLYLDSMFISEYDFLSFLYSLFIIVYFLNISRLFQSGYPASTILTLNRFQSKAFDRIEKRSYETV